MELWALFITFCSVTEVAVQNPSPHPPFRDTRYLTPSINNCSARGLLLSSRYCSVCCRALTCCRPALQQRLRRQRAGQQHRALLGDGLATRHGCPVRLAGQHHLDTYRHTHTCKSSCNLHSSDIPVTRAVQVGPFPARSAGILLVCQV